MAGPVTLKEICSCLDRLGFPDPDIKARPTQQGRLTLARKNIAKTVKAMGGVIEWIVPVEEALRKREIRRKRTIKKWKASRSNITQ